MAGASVAARDRYRCAVPIALGQFSTTVAGGEMRRSKTLISAVPTRNSIGMEKGPMARDH
jgi:hypothetical protein